MTALAGRLPSDEMPQSFTLDALTLPVELPVSLPAKLVEQRPDIKIAEANLHAASAEVGVAIANMLPNITLSAADGTVGTEVGQLFGPGAGFWSIGAGLTQPIFDGGQLLHKSRAAKELLNQASAQYQATVIAALQNVADALHAVQSDGEALRTAAAAAAAAQKSFDIAKRQMDAGQIGRLQLLNAQQAICKQGWPYRRRKPRAFPIPLRCFRRWAAAGGIAPTKRLLPKNPTACLISCAHSGKR